MAEVLGDALNLSEQTAVERSSAPQRVASPATNPGLGVVQPKPQALPSRQGPSAILVSTRQKGNPVLNHVKQLPWEYSDIPCDYVLGATTCALFLSLKYHRLHPEYIYSRIRQLGKLYNLRILLCMVDINNHEEALKELSKTSMINNLTLILSWSSQEAGHYLELFKAYEHASPASIRAHQAETYTESLEEFITTPRTINKTDAGSLIMNFGSVRAAVNAQPEELALVPGWGEKKVKAWSTSVREPFRVKRAAKSSAALLRQETSVISDGQSTPGSRPGSALAPLPIDTASSLSRRDSGAVLPSENSEAGPSQKRPRLEEMSIDDIDFEEEAALLAIAEQEAAMAGTEEPKSAPIEKRKEPELSAGLAAALAKLRQNG